VRCDLNSLCLCVCVGAEICLWTGGVFGSCLAHVLVLR
jgi:hypothetical protein